MRARIVRRSLACSAVAASGVLVTAADAQQLSVPRPPSITPPGKSLAGTEDVDAIALSPAGLAFLPSWQIAYLHQQIPTTLAEQDASTGDVISAATPIALGFSLGARVESVRPQSLPDTSSLTLAIAYRVSETLSFAVDARRWYAGGIPALDGALGLGVSMNWRPCRYIGASIVGSNLNEPSQGTFVGLTRRADVGVALRPLGTRAIELGLESSFWERRDAETWWSPRATLGVDIPGLGRANAAYQIGDPEKGYAGASGVFSIGLDLAWGGARVQGGAVGVGDPVSAGWYAGASLAGFTQKPALSFGGDRGVIVKIEETPGVRGHVKLLRKLARLGRDPSVRAIALVLKSAPAANTARAEEIADAITALKAKGIKVLCHLEDAGGKSLLACSSADKISIQPAGGLRFAGLRFESMYYGDALRKLGVVPDFVRIKEHKTAAETLVRGGPTEIATQDERELLRGLDSVYVKRIAEGRKLSQDAVRAIIARGPFVADEAVAAGLIDDKAFDDEVPKRVQAMVGEKIPVGEDTRETVAPKSFGPVPRIAVVYLDGDIVDGRSQTIPLLGEKTAGSYTIAEALKSARENPEIKGVILRIESPGGSSLASDVMWREAELLSKAKPTIVSMGGVAASGGYYAAAFGSRIYADASTVTGSIGIFYGKADVTGLLDKIGVHVVTEKTAPRADAESLYRPFTDEEREELSRKVEQFYAVFLDRVARGRGMKVEEVDAVGRGKVWLGQAAKDRKLIDEIGGFDAAFAAMRKELSLPEDVPIAEYPQVKESLLDVAINLLGIQASSSTPQASLDLIAKAIAPFSHALMPFVVYRSDEPLALWDGANEP